MTMFSSSLCKVVGASAWNQKVFCSAAALMMQSSGISSGVGRGQDPNFKVHVKHGTRTAKHKSPFFRKERAAKMIKVDLIDFNEDLESLTPQEIRLKMKVRGLEPFRTWDERPVNLASTPATFEQYIPPESDGKLSITTKDGAKQKLEWVTKKGRSYLAVRKIQGFDEDFDIKVFVPEAQETYIKAIKALAEEDDDKLHELITERAYPLMTHETKNKTLRWQFIETIEQPRAVHARVTDVISKENLFAQITIRMHTKQTLAVYDRFGRLMHGSEVLAKDVLEYVVFEKHISNTYGTWRVHDKIVPDWAPSLLPTMRTFRVKPAEPSKDAPQPAEEQSTADPPRPADGSDDSPRPALA
uniref:Large ribosomal subunit protein mL45 n=1 Tax=Hirondellea gigas TaxID=1518452 RepID=A0A2P2HZI2_9CRUS